MTDQTKSAGVTVSDVASTYSGASQSDAAALAKAREALIAALSDDQPYIVRCNEALAAIDALGQQSSEHSQTVADLRTLLSEAADDLEAWGAYASEYFREKHDLAGCIVKYRVAAGALGQPEGGKRKECHHED